MNSGEEKKHKCGVCEYATNNPYALKAHERIHTGEKPFKCDQCNYASVAKAALNSHKRKHTGEKPYKCDQCNYASAHNSSLTLHKRTHTGEKPYKCDQCNYASRENSTLTAHKRTHTNEKPYKCYQCNFVSAHRSNLKNHKRRHSVEKPYKCDRCNYTCKLYSYLTKHKIRHTSKRAFKCSRCDFSCNGRNSLTHHERTSHIADDNEPQCPGCKATNSKGTFESHLQTCQSKATINRKCRSPSHVAKKRIKPCSVQLFPLSAERLQSFVKTTTYNDDVTTIKREPTDLATTDSQEYISEGKLIGKQCFKIAVSDIKKESVDFMDEAPIPSIVTQDYLEFRDAQAPNIKTEHTV